MGIKVPDTTNFNLQDVYNAVGDHTPATTGDLRSCFTNAISAYFDSDYDNSTYAPAMSLKRFRNYTPFYPPSAGTSTLPMPNSGGYRLVGRLIYVSPNGRNLYICYTQDYGSSVGKWLVRFTLTNAFDPSTAVYHSLRNLGSSTDAFLTMRFSADGKKLILMSDVAIPTTGNTKIFIWNFSTAWDITTAISSYIYEASSTTDSARAERLGFINSGNTMVLIHTRYGNVQRFNFYNLSAPYTLPSTVINPNSWTDCCAVANPIIGFDIFGNTIELALSSFSPNTGIVITNSSISYNPYFTNGQLTIQYTFTSFPKVSDVFTIENMDYTFILESNTNSIDPLFPRVYLRIN